MPDPDVELVADDDEDHCYHHQHSEDCEWGEWGDCDDEDDCMHCDCCCTCLGCEYGPRDGMLLTAEQRSAVADDPGTRP